MERRATRAHLDIVMAAPPNVSVIPAVPESTTKLPLHDSRPSASLFRSMWPFAKSVFIGALSGAAPILIVSVPFGAMSLVWGWNVDGSVWPSLWLAAVPLVVALAIVLVASIVIGLPLTHLMRRRGTETKSTYIRVGALAGVVIPTAILVLMRAPTGYWMCILGAVSGAVTGRTWWISAREPALGD